MSPVSCDTFPPPWCRRKATPPDASQNSTVTLRGSTRGGLKQTQRPTGAVVTLTPEGTQVRASSPDACWHVLTVLGLKRSLTFVLFYFSQADGQHPETGRGQTEEPGWQREKRTWGLREGPKTRQSSSYGDSDFHSLYIFWLRFIWKQSNTMRILQFPGWKRLKSIILGGETHSFLGWVGLWRLPAACHGRPGWGRSPTPGLRCQRWQTDRCPPPHLPPSVGTSERRPARWTAPSSVHPLALGFSESDAVERDLQKPQTYQEECN